MPRFEKGEFDSVTIVFTEFKSAMTQTVAQNRLLPLGDPPKDSAGAPAATAVGPSEFIYEPSQRALLERLVPMYVEISIYRAMLESQASFFGAQMTAMDAATRNAKERITKLTLVYNRARQAAITKELMEIIGGAEALKDWDPKRDFSLAMLHAERLTRILSDEAIAELLLDQAKANPKRREVLERWLARAELRSKALYEEITTTGERILASLANENANGERLAAE